VPAFSAANIAMMGVGAGLAAALGLRSARHGPNDPPQYQIPTHGAYYTSTAAGSANGGSGSGTGNAGTASAPTTPKAGSSSAASSAAQHYAAYGLPSSRSTGGTGGSSGASNTAAAAQQMREYYGYDVCLPHKAVHNCSLGWWGGHTICLCAAACLLNCDHLLRV
jgi:hypothetical protein